MTRDRPTRTLRRAVGLAMLVAASANAQSVSVEYGGAISLAESTRDQCGRSVRVTNLSGVTHLHDDRYAAVSDRSGHVFFLTVTATTENRLAAAITGALALDEALDFEGIAYPGGDEHTVLLCEEDTPSIREYSLVTGRLVRVHEVPAVLRRAGSRVDNKSLESLAFVVIDGERRLMTANEEGLAVDAPLSSPDRGTVVRLITMTDRSGAFRATSQYAYRTEPMHGAAREGAASGLVDLAGLPDGRLLALERSFATDLSGMFRTSLFEVDLRDATDVHADPLDRGLLSHPYTVARKHLLYEGALLAVGQNVEGLTVGPEVAPGVRALVAVVDDGDPISRNALVWLTLRDLERR